MTTVTLFTSLLFFALTIGVLWINPHRFSNQVFALVTSIQTVSLAIVYRAKHIAEFRPPDYIEQFESLLRANAAVISFLPAAIWLLKNAIITPTDRRRALQNSSVLFILSTVTVFVCYSDSFIFVESKNILQRGPAYYIYSIMAVAVYGICLIQVCRQMRSVTGIQRVELQFLTLNTGGAALLLVILNALGNYFDLQSLKSLGLSLMFLASAMTAWALVFHQVFNAGELLLQLGRQVSFILVLTGGVYAIWRLTSILVDEPLSLLISVGLFSPIAIWIDRKSRDWFESNGRRKLNALRQATIQIANSEFDPEKLALLFEALLRAECRTTRSTILFDNGNSYDGTSLRLPKTSADIQTLAELGWATPESLTRRRSRPRLENLQRLLATNSLGLMLSVPQGNPSPSMLIAFGVRRDESPFTYPEIQRLQNATELMSGVIMRSKVINQSSLEARLEYLAMASRGLAHDLKNLITPISAYFFHTRNRPVSDEAEREAQAIADRSIRMMTDYVQETLFFSQELRPKFGPSDLRAIAEGVREICAPRATARNVQITVISEVSDVIIADSILLQRVITNLVNNAIDASASGGRIWITIQDIDERSVRIEVNDNGSGITPENISRIFDPYFTTKNAAGEARGIGLGLTIAQKIVVLHRGTISARSHPNVETTIAINLPPKQPLT